MAKANRSKAAPEKTYTLAESQLNEIEVSLEQIEGMAELINSHYDNVASDVGTISALNVIREKSRWCGIVLRAGYAEKHQLDVIAKNTSSRGAKKTARHG